MDTIIRTASKETEVLSQCSSSRTSRQSGSRHNARGSPDIPFYLLFSSAIPSSHQSRTSASRRFGLSPGYRGPSTFPSPSDQYVLLEKHKDNSTAFSTISEDESASTADSYAQKLNTIRKSPACIAYESREPRSSSNHHSQQSVSNRMQSGLNTTCPEKLVELVDAALGQTVIRTTVYCSSTLRDLRTLKGIFAQGVVTTPVMASSTNQTAMTLKSCQMASERRWRTCLKDQK